MTAIHHDFFKNLEAKTARQNIDDEPSEDRDFCQLPSVALPPNDVVPPTFVAILPFTFF